MNLTDVKKDIRLGKRKKRVGRGRASGHGKTCGRGQKGYKSRKGSSLHPTYEGGQTPLFMRVAKRGFTNGRFRKTMAVVNLKVLDQFDAGSTIGLEELQAKGWVDNPKDGLKVLGKGELSKKLTVRAQAFSKTAREAIEKAGGTCELIAPKKKGPTPNKLKNNNEAQA